MTYLRWIRFFTPDFSANRGCTQFNVNYTKTSQMGFICHITNEAVAVVSDAEVFQLDW